MVVAEREIDYAPEVDARVEFAWVVPADEAEFAHMTNGHQRLIAG